MTHYLLVDGYNVIHANAALSGIAADSVDLARTKLCDALCEFRALSQYKIIVVFDAHLVPGGVENSQNYRGITVVFTREAETADAYIERAAHTKKNVRITVATSDALEQIIVVGQGATRISAEDLWTQIEKTRAEVLARYEKTRPIKKNPIEIFLDEKTAKRLDEMRYEK
ncbi:MAG: NYN domain-containing protein [Defluviitaleaceae bacterium]|nr:NYN domain-containing protein [Defluviitaleaceae bacterium]